MQVRGSKAGLGVVMGVYLAGGEAASFTVLLSAGFLTDVYCVTVAFKHVCELLRICVIYAASGPQAAGFPGWDLPWPWDLWPRPLRPAGGSGAAAVQRRRGTCHRVLLSHGG